jgi:hypothetical protein
MTEANYAFIKNGQVVNVAIFDDSINTELLLHFKNEFKLDMIILANEKTAIGGTYDGSKFWLPQPYPSWTKNEELHKWEAPIPYPAVEEGSDEIYTWDEPTTSWLLLPPSN